MRHVQFMHDFDRHLRFPSARPSINSVTRLRGKYFCRSDKIELKFEMLGQWIFLIINVSLKFLRVCKVMADIRCLFILNLVIASPAGGA